jgi:hypothetical protein
MSKVVAKVPMKERLELKRSKTVGNFHDQT